ncbi:hypothetical protein A9K71_10150 [Mesorhizobium sp. WSM3873]|nr:hypothetical protein A9K71_10150 [Mesorhizobium sp. WSM3873]
MAELAVTVRWNIAARVLIWVDKRSQRFDAFEPRIKVKPKFSGNRQVRALTGPRDDPVDGTNRSHAIRRHPFHHQTTVDIANSRCCKASDQLNAAALNEISGIRSELAPRRQGIKVAATVDADKVSATRQPCPWFRLCKFGQLQQRIGGGVTRTRN